MKQTLNYYNQNAKAFIEGTINADMSQAQQRFLKYLPQGSHILDAGCGSGRDSLTFLHAGYKVTAIDGSEELCRHASRLIGQPVRHQYFEDIDEVEVYDGIWACATLLHVASDTIGEVMARMTRGLKSGGYFYVSFKYGTFEGERNGRYFTDYTEETFEQLMSYLPQLNVIEWWLTEDVRPDRDEKWLNAILKKVNDKA